MAAHLSFCLWLYQLERWDTNWEWTQSGRYFSLLWLGSRTAMPPHTVVTCRPPKMSPIDKMFLKVENLKDSKIFTICHIDISHSDDLKELTHNGSDIKECDALMWVTFRVLVISYFTLVS